MSILEIYKTINMYKVYKYIDMYNIKVLWNVNVFSVCVVLIRPWTPFCVKGNLSTYNGDFKPGSDRMQFHQLLSPIFLLYCFVDNELQSPRSAKTFVGDFSRRRRFRLWRCSKVVIAWILRTYSFFPSKVSLYFACKCYFLKSYILGKWNVGNYCTFIMLQI